jgi:hypothetical protein
LNITLHLRHQGFAITNHEAAIRGMVTEGKFFIFAGGRRCP